MENIGPGITLASGVLQISGEIRLTCVYCFKLRESKHHHMKEKESRGGLRHE